MIMASALFQLKNAYALMMIGAFQLAYVQKDRKIKGYTQVLWKNYPALYTYFRTICTFGFFSFSNFFHLYSLLSLSSIL